MHFTKSVIVLRLLKGGKLMTIRVIPNNVKHTIKDLRIRMNMSQSQAAKRLGVSEPTLRKWERDSSTLTYKDMQRISNMYKIPLDYIFFGSNNTFSEIKNKEEN